MKERKPSEVIFSGCFVIAMGCFVCVMIFFVIKHGFIPFLIILFVTACLLALIELAKHCMRKLDEKWEIKAKDNNKPKEQTESAAQQTSQPDEP